MIWHFTVLGNDGLEYQVHMLEPISRILPELIKSIEKDLKIEIVDWWTEDELKVVKTERK
jgi:hypothetical protein